MECKHTVALYGTARSRASACDATTTLQSTRLLLLFLVLVRGLEIHVLVLVRVVSTAAAPTSESMGCNAGGPATRRNDCDKHHPDLSAVPCVWVTVTVLDLDFEQVPGRQWNNLFFECFSKKLHLDFLIRLDYKIQRCLHTCETMRL